MVTTLFFHSFSLLKWRDRPDAPEKNEKNLAKLQSAVRAVAENKDMRFITEADLDSVTVADAEQAMKSDIKWQDQVKGFAYTYIKALKIVKTNRKARGLVVAVGAITCMLIVAIVLILLL